MISVRTEKTIQAPREAVFQTFSDFARAAERIPAIHTVEMLTDGPVRKGTRFRETRVMQGKQSTEEMEVIDFEPVSHYTLETFSHWTRFRTTYHFIGTGPVTSVVATFVGEPRKFLGRLTYPLALMMKGVMKSALDEDLAAMKKVCEHSTPRDEEDSLTDTESAEDG